MSANPENFMPRFKIDDRVTVSFPGIFRDEEGFVKQVIGHHGDHVYRYRVRFANGKSSTFFEFELKESGAERP